MNTQKGIGWISDEAHSEAWRTEDDTKLLSEHPVCTVNIIAEHVQGAINIEGMGAPVPYVEARKLKHAITDLMSELVVRPLARRSGEAKDSS